VTVPAIELREASKSFVLESGEQTLAVDAVNLTVPRGQFVCVLGPSGHGKSTMLNLIAGFTAPTSGEVLAGGRVIKGPGRDRGVVFQRDTLFMWRRVADNIGFGLQASRVPKEERLAIVAHYLDVIGMTKYARAWPRQLSGGMRRRVAIAAVFANEPDVLLMDEPFVGLDYARRASLHSVLLDLWQDSGRTVFFITHDVDEALALGDRMLVVISGKVVYDKPIQLARPRTAEMINDEYSASVRVEVLRLMQSGIGLPTWAEVNA
jgi:NitT/TauT family transport system ATP-binding protein